MGFKELQQQVRDLPKQSIAVAWAQDPPVLEACLEAKALGLVGDVFLTGEQGELERIAKEHNLSLSQCEIIPASTPKEAAEAAVSLVVKKKASLLMKGLLGTATLLKAVLDKENGLRLSGLLSHIGILEFPDNRLVLLTDGGMNIRPDLEQKIQIVNNAINFAYDLGIIPPKVALLAAVELVNPKMQETLDAAAIVQMAARNQLVKKAIVDGPLAMDNAVSKEAALHKGIVSEVAGAADILVVPEIVAGNVIYKSLTYVGTLKGAGIIAGARCPIVLTSRADTKESKVNSIMAACRAAGR